MAITFRHDAAAVALPSINNGGRKYGQSLVLQQQQQKYQAQQAGLNRLFDTQSQYRQNQFQNFRDMQQNNWQMARDNQQNTWAVERDKMQFDQQQQQQRAQDFASARDRLDGYAQDALNTPNLDPNIAKRIRDLRAGKMAVLGGGFNPVEQQQFLDQYNAQLAAILSEIPPPQPQAPPKPNFHTDGSGNTWIEQSPGKWEQVPQQQAQPKTAGEAFRADPKLRDKYVEEAIAILTNGNENPGEAADRRKVNAKAMELYDIDQSSFGGNPPMQLPSEKTPAEPGTVDPVTGQVIQSGSYEPAPTGIGMDYPLFEDGATPQQPQPEIPISPPDPGQPPSPPKQESKLNDALMKWAESRGWLDQQQPPAGASPGRMPLTANSTSQKPAYGQMPDISQVGTGYNDLLYRPTNPDGSKKEPPKPTGKKDSRGYMIMDDGSKVDPRDAYAMGGGATDMVYRPTHPDGSQKGPAKPTGKKDKNGYIIMDDGSKVDPRDDYAMRGTGMIDMLDRTTHPNGSIKQPPKPTGKKDSKGYIIMDDGSKVDPRDTYALRGLGSEDVLRDTNPDGSIKPSSKANITLQGLEESAGSGMSAGEPPMAFNRTEQRIPAEQAMGRAQEPDFAKLQAGADNDIDRNFFRQMSDIYKQQQSPEVRGAISVVLNPGSLDEEFAMATDYLKSLGIDVEAMVEPPKKGRKKNRDWDTGRGM